MRSRFITNVLALVAGGFVVVASQAFSANTTGWITFGISLGILGMIAVAQLDRSRGRLQSGFDATIGLLSIWSAVASMVFNGSVLTWLSFADTLGLAALALAALIGNEVSTVRDLHNLAAREHAGEPAVRAAEPYSAAA
jgi:hypothetical protein